MYTPGHQVTSVSKLAFASIELTPNPAGDEENILRTNYAMALCAVQSIVHRALLYFDLRYTNSLLIHINNLLYQTITFIGSEAYIEKTGIVLI